jgi:DNA-directed RNA polymerase subunit RPC12/RpoP
MHFDEDIALTSWHQDYIYNARTMLRYLPFGIAAEYKCKRCGKTYWFKHSGKDEALIKENYAEYREYVHEREHK